MSPALGLRAWTFKPRGSAVDSGRRDHLHFHLDREVMLVFHEFTKRVQWGTMRFHLTLKWNRLQKIPEKDSCPKMTVFVRKTL